LQSHSRQFRLARPKAAGTTPGVRKLADILREQQRDDPRDLRSRSDARRERKQSEDHLVDLARRLTALKPRQLDRLALPETLLEAVMAARKITSPVAHARQLRIVRREIRVTDAAQLEQSLEDLVQARRTSPLRAESVKWAGELVEGGDDAIQRFLERYPGGDRQRLRQLARGARRERDSGPKASATSQLVAEVTRIVQECAQDDDAATSE